MSALISSAMARHCLGVLRPAVQLGQLGPAVQRHPAHDLARGEVLRLAAHLPDAAVGLAPVLDGLLDLLLEHRPQRLRNLLAGPGVQIHRVQHRTPDVVLHLVVGAVADPHRTGIVVSGQVMQLLLDQAALAANAIHHLKWMALIVVRAGHVGDEREEVVGLAVQAQRVEAPERECRVSDPGVAVVPIAFALRGFRQRRGARRQQRSGRRVGQPLQRQRAALQVRPPRVIREVADVDPLPPAFAGRPHLVDGLVVRLGRGMLRKAQCDKDVVALFQPRARPRLAALQPDAQVGGQPQRRVRIRVMVRPRNGFPVATGRVLPVRAGPVVIERRLAIHHQLDGAAHAAHGAQHRVFGVPVHRYAAMRPRPRLDVAPRAHHHRVADDHPAGVGLPGGLQDQAARQVPPAGRDGDAVGAEPEVPGAAIQDGPEHAWRIGPWHAQPFHRSTRGDQAGVLAVGEKGVVGDGRKGVSQTARQRLAPGRSRRAARRSRSRRRASHAAGPCGHH